MGHAVMQILVEVAHAAVTLKSMIAHTSDMVPVIAI